MIATTIERIDLQAELDEVAKISPNGKFHRVLQRIARHVKEKYEDDSTELMRSSRYDRTPFYPDILLSCGAELEARDNCGRNALMYAACNSNPAMTQCLLDAGADVHAQDQDGDRAIDYALEYNSNSEVIRVLEDAEANNG